MKKLRNKDVLSSFNKSFEILFSLESIIKITYDACLEKELYSKYYNLLAKEKCLLSEERNHYINLLSVALDKLSSLKELNNSLEDELIKLQ